MVPDLKFYYDVDLVDVIQGRGPSPLLVLLYVQRLPDTSLTTALMRGGRHHFGWGVDRHIAVDSYDALNVNTRVSGQWKKPPTFPLWPRPNSETTAESKPKKPKVSVAQLWGRMSKKL